MKEPIYSALFVLSFLLAGLNLGVSQEQESSRSDIPATQTAVRSEARNEVGQEGAKDKAQPVAQKVPGEPALTETPTPSQTNAVGPWRAILAGKTVAVIGKDRGIGGSDRNWERTRWMPTVPNPRRAKERVEKSFQKWGRFTLVEDETGADLIVVAIEGTRLVYEWGSPGNHPCALLLIFKGPGPVAKDAVPIWQRQFIQETWGMFRGKMPATILAEDFRKDLEAFEKSTGLAQGHPEEAARGTPGARQAAQSEDSEAEHHFTRGSQLMSLQLRDPSIGLDHTVGGTAVDAIIDEFRQVLYYRPFDPDAHNNVGAGQQISGNLDEAIVEYRQALRLKPDSSEAHGNLGIALANKKVFDGAVFELREALRLNSVDPKAFRLGTDWDCRHYLVQALMDKGDLEGAIAELRETLRLKPDLADTHFLLGTALEKKGDKAGALEAFRQAHTLAPQNAEYKARYEELSRQ